ncbi:MAG TPA: hypothetical protein VL574_13525 [Stellaceae bacterium]|nr:hypothetical protein [Stellaceae bacterium]
MAAGWLRRLKAENVPLDTWARSLRQGRRLLGLLLFAAMVAQAALYTHAEPGFGHAILPSWPGSRPETTAMATDDGTKAQDLAGFIERQWGVHVSWADPAHFRAWDPKLDPTGWHVEPIAQADIVPALKLVIQALSVYPPDFVRRTMGPLVLCGDLSIDGDHVGGVTYISTIFIIVPPLDDAATRVFVRDTVHHEFSTLALSQGTLDDKAWSAANPAGFAYAIAHDANAKLEATQITEDPAGSATLHAQGFLSRYGQASIRNDFNTYADAVFGHPADLVALMLRYPRIRQKAGLFQAAYIALDPDFGGYFARVGVMAAAP